MSQWGKFLAAVVVPTGGWDFSWSDGTNRTLTVPAGTYTTVLDLLDEMHTQHSAVVGTCSSTGQVVLTVSSINSMRWSYTTDALSSCLGFAETESPSAGAVTATNRHTHGWYPGTISFGYTKGEGLAADSEWQPDEAPAVAVAGSGTATVVAGSRPIYRRTLLFDLIKQTELVHRTRGVMAMAVAHRTVDVCWFQNRDIGTVAAQGTKGDPHSSSSADYWSCKTTIQWEPNGTNPDYYSVQVDLIGQP
jgi:hypothetical protein